MEYTKSRWINIRSHLFYSQHEAPGEGEAKFTHVDFQVSSASYGQKPKPGRLVVSWYAGNASFLEWLNGLGTGDVLAVLEVSPHNHPLEYLENEVRIRLEFGNIERLWIDDVGIIWPGDEEILIMHAEISGWITLYAQNEQGERVQFPGGFMLSRGD
jgi:hypothetical protein